MAVDRADGLSRVIVNFLAQLWHLTPLFGALQSAAHSTERRRKRNSALDKRVCAASSSECQRWERLIAEVASKDITSMKLKQNIFLPTTENGSNVRSCFGESFLVVRNSEAAALHAGRIQRVTQRTCPC